MIQNTFLFLATVPLANQVSISDQQRYTLINSGPPNVHQNKPADDCEQEKHNSYPE